MNINQFYSQLAIDLAEVPDVGTLTDQQVAEAVNARTIAGTRTIPAAELVAWAAGGA